MTVYTKPAVRNAWGQTATGSDLVDPGNTYASAGWQIGVKPPRQYFNWVLNYAVNAVRYFCQAGIPDWDAAETYSLNQYTRDASGYLYLSLINNNTGNAPNASPAQWANPAVRTPNRAIGTWQVPNIAYLEANFLPVGSSFTAISGSIQNSQVPVSAVTQWQGSLSISGGQITSAVARAVSVYLNGNYVTINWTGQSGQPAWLFGSNDGASIAVWNPSNFNVANANTVAGLGVTSAASANTVMSRDGSGYAYAQYFNQASGNNDGSPISQIITTNGSDGFFRKQSVAAVKAAMGALSTADFPALLSANGYQKFPTGVILQWGTAFISGTTTVSFPVTFPNGVSHVSFTNINSTNQIFLTSLAAAGFTASNGSATVSWLAMGY